MDRSLLAGAADMQDGPQLVGRKTVRYEMPAETKSGIST